MVGPWVLPEGIEELPGTETPEGRDMGAHAGAVNVVDSGVSRPVCPDQFQLLSGLAATQSIMRQRSPRLPMTSPPLTEGQNMGKRTKAPGGSLP